MATTKIWPVKDSTKRLIDYASNPDKTTESDLTAVIEYAMNGDKIVSSEEKACYVSGINCSAGTALDEMLGVQRQFGKTGGNVAYHCYPSFRPGEITPEECHRLGVELARRMWGLEYQVLVATHLDKDHLHNHLVCNSVSLIDGKKFNCNKAAYRKLRRLSDDICIENGYSVIEKPRGKTPRQLYFAEKNGEPTRYNLMRDAVDDCISLSTNYREFIQLMWIHGYEIIETDTRKYPNIRPLTSSKNTRIYQLGEEYELPRIRERIFENSIDDVYNRRDEYERIHRQPRRSVGYVNGHRKIGGLKVLYYKYLYLMGYRPKQKHRPLSPDMREAMRMCDKYSACARLLGRERIGTMDDLKGFIDRSKSEMDVLSRERNKVRNLLRREKNPETVTELKDRRNALTEKICTLRRDIKLADFTLERSEKVARDIQIEHKFCRGEHYKEQERDRKPRKRDDWER